MFVPQCVRASRLERLGIDKLKNTLCTAVAAGVALSLLDVTRRLHGKEAVAAFHLVGDHLFQHLQAIRRVRLSLFRDRAYLAV